MIRTRPEGKAIAASSLPETEERTRALYGAPLGPAQGVLHVVAVAREPDGLRVLRIGDASPKSPTDLFVLRLARSRVDAIVITGAILRAEPDLRYDEFLPLGPARAPLLVVLTGGGGLPRAHPVWESRARPVVYTASDVSLDLPERVEVVRVAQPTPRGVLRYLLEERGCGAVSVEAGPRVATPLYDEPVVVDELMLSVFEGALPAEARGGRFVDPGVLDAHFEVVGGPTAVEEQSGRWTFARLLRRRG